MADREPDDSGSGEAMPADRDGRVDADAERTTSLRDAVEAKYDFDDFRPADMARMTLEEWEAAFDPESWITGPALLDRVEAELRSRVASGALFAVVERPSTAGDSPVLAYTDAGYALVHPEGTVEGEGAIVHEVEPVVALCSMDSFEVADPPAGGGLPDPASIRSGSGDLGHRLLLVIAAAQVVAGLVLFLSPVVVDVGPGAGALTTVVGLGFVAVGLVIAGLVANARLSDRFRAAEYRDRLQAAGVGSDERPSFLPTIEGLDDGVDPSRDEGS